MFDLRGGCQLVSFSFALFLFCRIGELRIGYKPIEDLTDDPVRSDQTSWNQHPDWVIITSQIKLVLGLFHIKHMVRLCNAPNGSISNQILGKQNWHLTLRECGHTRKQKQNSLLPRHAETPIYPCVGLVCCATCFPASSMYMCPRRICVTTWMEPNWTTYVRCFYASFISGELCMANRLQ